MSRRLVAAAFVALLAVACGGGSDSSAPEAGDAPSLEGGWRARATFTSGPLQGRRYQILITYSSGGGLVASSTVDDQPGYGSWGRADGGFKSTYVFWTRGDQGVSGSGVFSENINLSETGDEYSSGISYQLFNANDEPRPGQTGRGTVTASRIIVG